MKQPSEAKLFASSLKHQRHAYVSQEMLCKYINAQAAVLEGCTLGKSTSLSGIPKMKCQNLSDNLCARSTSSLWNNASGEVSLVLVTKGEEVYLFRTLNIPRVNCHHVLRKQRHFSIEHSVKRFVYSSVQRWACQKRTNLGITALIHADWQLNGFYWEHWCESMTPMSCKGLGCCQCLFPPHSWSPHG